MRILVEWKKRSQLYRGSTPTKDFPVEEWYNWTVIVFLCKIDSSQTVHLDLWYNFPIPIPWTKQKLIFFCLEPLISSLIAGQTKRLGLRVQLPHKFSLSTPTHTSHTFSSLSSMQSFGSTTFRLRLLSISRCRSTATWKMKYVRKRGRMHVIPFGPL